MKRRRFLVQSAATGAVASIGVSALAASGKMKPNILWVTCEDNNVDWVGCYGNPHANTPNIDALAAEGFQYMHCYANAPVCAPSRSTWITGVNAISMGTHPMRSRYDIPHERIKYYPDMLRENGYFCGNDRKTDYNIGGRGDDDCWDNAKKIEWDKLKQRQPFFQVLNFTDSHESKAQGDVENTEHDPADTRLRSYHPDLPDVRKTYAKYHDAMKNMDDKVGEALKQLEDAGLAENTIVIHNSDHGGVLPRSKRYIFKSGVHCPLIIRVPEKYKHLKPASRPGTKIDRLVSFVDMPKTWLNITGSTVPDYMQGRIFLGPDAEPEADYHFAFRGRMDERVENARAVNDKRFLYIRNYMPYAPWMQKLDYLWKMKATQAWADHVEAGKASEIEARFFKPKGWTEELYDNVKDPDNVNNLIGNPEYAQVVEEMNIALRSWQLEIHDSGLLPESEIVKRATDHGKTIYDMVRDPKLYDLPGLLSASDLALEEKPENRSKLRRLMKKPDAGLRYWGMVGCFLLNDEEAGMQGLEDESHEVRALAAWQLIRSGKKDAGFQCLENLLRGKSYATLTILNMLDWIGPDAERLAPMLKDLKLERYETRMRNVFLAKIKAS